MRKTAAVTTALAMMATPALAQGQGGQGGQGQGQSTSPAKICAKIVPLPQGKRKVPGTSGQSAWAACVSGVKKQTSDQRQGKTNENPARYCTAQKFSKRKAPGNKKSPYGACVSGYAKAQNDANQS